MAGFVCSQSPAQICPDTVIFECILFRLPAPSTNFHVMVVVAKAKRWTAEQRYHNVLVTVVLRCWAVIFRYNTARVSVISAVIGFDLQNNLSLV